MQENSNRMSDLVVFVITEKSGGSLRDLGNWTRLSFGSGALISFSGALISSMLLRMIFREN